MEDERYYIQCPIRKNEAKVPVTVCQKRRCIHLESQDGELRCGYSLENYKSGPRKGHR